MRNFITYSSELEGKELIDQIRLEEPDVPIVSNSQINSWNRCEQQYHLGYVEQWTEREPKTWLTLGTLGHESLATWYRTGSREAVQAVLSDHFNQYAFARDDYLPMLAEEGWLVLRYIDDFVPSADVELETVHAVEEHFILAIMTPKGRKFYLQGYIDLRTTFRGQLWLWDHKFSGKFKSQKELQMDPQLPLYAAALKLYGLEVFGVILNQLNTYEYKKKEGVSPDQLFRRDYNYLGAAQMNNTLMEVCKAVDDLIEWKEAGANPRRRLSQDCARCWFQGPCLMGLQGHNMDNLLLVDFRKKNEDDTERVIDDAELNIHL